MMRMLRSLCVLVLALMHISTPSAAQVPLPIDRPTNDSVLRALKQRVRDELADAITAQREAWKQEELREHGELPRQPDREPGMQRLAMMHCHTDGRFHPSRWASKRTVTPAMTASGFETLPVEDKPYPVPTLLRSRVRLVALCPNWLPEARFGAKASHEHRGVDLDVARLAPYPDSVVALLEGATRTAPGDPFFVGQLIRVLVENGRAEDAMGRAGGCSADVGWCELLRGFALHAAGRWVAADSVYRAVVTALPIDARCDLLLLQPLLPSVDSTRYGDLPCAARDTIDSRMWWLATPFFSDRGNMRLVEHLTRRIRNALVGQLSADPYYDLRAEVGGDAVVAMRTRYGWPTHLFRAGAEHETEHFGYQQAHNAPPFSAAEYARPALALFQPLQVVMEPLSVRASSHSSIVCVALVLTVRAHALACRRS